MSLKRTSTKIGAGLVALAVAAACSKSTNSPTTTPGTNTNLKAGGTLYVLNTADFEHLDPARNYVSQALNFSRLLYRTLTTYKAAAGTAGIDIVPDLATTTGEASDGGKTWKFTLKDGLKYEDGSAITSQDIKYGVERSFSDLLPEGPQYAKLYLTGGDKYVGPYKDKKGLASIETPDAKTIIFHLSAPHGDFGYTVALPTFSPVPVAQDKGVNYDKRVFSSGPYKISKFSAGKELLLVRNTSWDKKTDTVRLALPDTIDVISGLDPSVIDTRLIASNGNDANAIQLDSSVQPENVQKVLTNVGLKSRTVGGVTGFIRYFAINTTVKPLDNLKVRQAVEYCTDKEAQQTARGGRLTSGDIAKHVLVPTVKGFTDFDPYPAPATGDVAKGKALLAEAGLANGFSTTIATSDKGKAVKQGTALQAALKRCNINATVANIPASTYYTTIGDPTKEAGIVLAGWGPDWPNASTVIPPLFDSRQIKPQGNQVFALFKGAKATEIDNAMDEASKLTDVDAAATKWGDLDKEIMNQALIIPLLIDKAQYIWGANVKNVYIHAFFGDPDMVALGVM